MYDVGIYVWDYYPPLIRCPEMERIGHAGDGGKYVCSVRDIRAPVLQHRSCVVGMCVYVCIMYKLLHTTVCNTMYDA